LARTRLAKLGWVDPSGYRLAVEAERIWRQKGKPQIQWRIKV
jgi:hypothetical protein